MALGQFCQYGELPGNFPVGRHWQYGAMNQYPSLREDDQYLLWYTGNEHLVAGMGFARGRIKRP